jgi:tetratricopeptide (TPR) repeat protein
MARAAAKRRPPVRHDRDRRKHKDSGGQRFEDTLFFNRLRKQAKWVFVLLAIVFGGGFVLFGVGSSNLGGLSDIFSGIGGNGSSGPSVKKELKRTQEHPKSAQAWRDLATAYDTKGDVDLAIQAWTTYTQLRPKNVDGWTQLVNDYESKFSTQTAEAQAAQADAISAQPELFGPPSTSPLGRGLGSVPDPITKAASDSASQRYSDALSARQQTAAGLVDAYKHVARIEPDNPSNQLLLADAATRAGDATTAIAAYRLFLKLAPDDPQAATAKQQIKALEAQLASAQQR